MNKRAIIICIVVVIVTFLIILFRYDINAQIQNIKTKNIKESTYYWVGFSEEWEKNDEMWLFYPEHKKIVYSCSEVKSHHFKLGKYSGYFYNKVVDIEENDIQTIESLIKRAKSNSQEGLNNATYIRIMHIKDGEIVKFIALKKENALGLYEILQRVKND